MNLNSFKICIILYGFVNSHSLEDGTDTTGGNSNSRSRLRTYQQHSPVFLAASQPLPSGSPRTVKRSIDPNSDAAKCPTPLASCPISSNNQSKSWECVNLNEELTSCGKCGNNCLSIPNAANVGCAKGACKILSCKSGYNLIQQIDAVSGRVVEVCAQPRAPF